MKRLFFISSTMVSLFYLSSCKEGCGDYFASNYNPDVKHVQSTCEYFGCTDEEATNYAPSAKDDDGSCEYPGDVYFYNHVEVPSGKVIEVYWEEEYAGSFGFQSQRTITYCVQTQEAVGILTLDPGNYRYEVVLKNGGVDNFSSPGTVIQSGAIYVEGDGCQHILIED